MNSNENTGGNTNTNNNSNSGMNANTNNNKAVKGKARHRFSFPIPHCLFLILHFSFLILHSSFFVSCPVETDDSWNGPTLKVVVGLNSGDAGAKYYSLATGKPADSDSTDWDLGFYSTDNTPSIFTNSGATAELLQSGGQGGVWHTDKALENAKLEDRVTENLGEYEPYTVDVYRWGKTMGVPALQRMNIMTYLGFPGGTGTEADPFAPHDMTDMGTYVGYNFDKKQFYKWHSMPPKYSPTGQTYLVRHGDGAGYSKIRVGELYLERPYGTNTEYVFEVQYENF